MIVAIGAGAWVLRGPTGLPAGEWTIGLDMPLSGGFAGGGVAVRNAVQLAIDEANEDGVADGVQLVLQPYDHAGDGEESRAELGAANATAMVDDARTIAMVGPYNSDVAIDQIPITNEAGLLQCSPSTTDPSLTKPAFGALELRPPSRIASTSSASRRRMTTRCAAWRHTRPTTWVPSRRSSSSVNRTSRSGPIPSRRRSRTSAVGSFDRSTSRAATRGNARAAYWTARARRRVLRRVRPGARCRAAPGDGASGLGPRRS